MSDEPIIVDNNMANSDWIKSFRLDIPGIETFTDAERLLGVPAQPGEERDEKLRQIMENYQWVDALPVFEQPIIRETLKLAGKKNETN
jgi:hypothetical protein